MVVFGYISGSFAVLVLFGLIGFTVQGGFTGLYSVCRSSLPDRSAHDRRGLGDRSRGVRARSQAPFSVGY